MQMKGEAVLLQKAWGGTEEKPCLIVELNIFCGQPLSASMGWGAAIVVTDSLMPSEACRTQAMSTLLQYPLPELLEHVIAQSPLLAGY